MSVGIKKFHKNISVHYYEGQYYVVGMVELPPLYLPITVSPLFNSPRDNVVKLTQAIESAYSISRSREQLNQVNLSIKDLSREEGKLLDKIPKFWSIGWEDNGNVYITLWEPFPKSETSTYKGKAWRPNKDSEVIFHPPVSNSDLAQWLIQQIK